MINFDQKLVHCLSSRVKACFWKKRDKTLIKNKILRSNERKNLFLKRVGLHFVDWWEDNGDAWNLDSVKYSSSRASSCCCGEVSSSQNRGSSFSQCTCSSWLKWIRQIEKRSNEFEYTGRRTPITFVVRKENSPNTLTHTVGAHKKTPAHTDSKHRNTEFDRRSTRKQLVEHDRNYEWIVVT